MSRRFPWLKLAKKTDPEPPLEPPIWLNDHSNGEYYHEQTPQERRMKDEILRRADDQARYLGMDRREFLASSMGMVTSMAVINQMTGCSSDGGTIEGPYLTPVEATCEETDLLKGDEFIFDVQTHSFDDGDWRETNTVYPIFLETSQSCPDRTNALDCMDQERYGRLMFSESDTTVAVITSWPAATCTEDRKLLGNDAKACGLPLSNDGMKQLRDWVNENARSQRVVNQVQIMPNDNLPVQVEIMQAAMEDPTWRAVSWKCYPAWRSDTYVNEDGHAKGYFLTDDVGRKFIETGLSLGVPNFAVHKGLPIPGFDVEHNVPSDVGPAAKEYPDANFIIYHSGIGSGSAFNALGSFSGPTTEAAPYDPDDPNPLGVNALIRSVLDADLGPGSNVFAELGSAWSNVMRDAMAAQHMMGKLLKYIGEDNIVWGTDCILSGSPQTQIEMFRAFNITPEFQREFGYPEITDEVRAKIFGLNAARIFRVDPDAKRCKVEGDTFASMRQELDGEYGPRRFTAQPPLGPRTRREFFEMARRAIAQGRPG